MKLTLNSLLFVMQNRTINLTVTFRGMFPILSHWTCKRDGGSGRDGRKKKEKRKLECGKTEMKKLKIVKKEKKMNKKMKKESEENEKKKKK